MPADQPLLLVFGGGDGADGITRAGERVTIAGSTDLGRLLPNREIHHRLLITRDQPPRPRPQDFSGYPVIVNMITEPESADSPQPQNIDAVLDAIRERMPLDFFGLDFALSRDGQIVLFEANAMMSFMPNLFIDEFDYLRRAFAPAQAAFMELVGLGQ